MVEVQPIATSVSEDAVSFLYPGLQWRTVAARTIWQLQQQPLVVRPFPVVDTFQYIIPSQYRTYKNTKVFLSWRAANYVLNGVPGFYQYTPVDLLAFGSITQQAVFQIDGQQKSFIATNNNNQFSFPGTAKTVTLDSIELSTALDFATISNIGTILAIGGAATDFLHAFMYIQVVLDGANKN